MNEEEARAALIDALSGSNPLYYEDAVEDLLPTVRQIVAAELRAAAGAIDVDSRVGDARRQNQAQRAVGEARSVVLERADALDPHDTGTGAR